MATQLDLIDKEIDATESLLKFQLDTARNTLIKVTSPKPLFFKGPGSQPHVKEPKTLNIYQGDEPPKPSPLIKVMNTKPKHFCPLNPCDIYTL